jgi:FkbM family methyltransferase
MSSLVHYFRVLKELLARVHTVGRAVLLITYIRLLIASVVHHRNTSAKKSNPEILAEKVFGSRITFFSYPQLINLFEEIFIYEVYRFHSNAPAPLVIDCGSNIGMSILYFKKSFPKCRVMAFEPSHKNFSALESNVKSNTLTDVTLFNFALSDQDAEGFLYKEPAPDALTMSLIPSARKTQTEKVITRKLSGLIQGKIDFLKIDVEGAEQKIISDLIQAGKMNSIEKMVVEFHPAVAEIKIENFIARLHECNFDCKTVKDSLHQGATEVLIYCDQIRK